MYGSLELMSYRIPPGDRRFVGPLVLWGLGQLFLATFVLPLFPDAWDWVQTRDVHVTGIAGGILFFSCIVFSFITIAAAMAVYVRDKDWWAICLNCVFNWSTVYILLTLGLHYGVVALFTVTPLALTGFAGKVIRQAIVEGRTE